MAWVFANPFYCGYIISSLLPGEVNIGKHPPIIDENTFLKVNNIGRTNPVHGIIKMKDQDELPLKIFMKDFKNESPFTGYYNKKKKIFYYKTRDKGSKTNVNAKKLNDLFLTQLKHFEFDPENRDILYDTLFDKLTKITENKKVDEKANKKKITELKGQIEALEERFVLNEITADQFAKFSKKYQSEIDVLAEEMDQTSNLSSNLKKSVEKGLKISQNVSQMWISGDFYDKQKLQRLIFPEGMYYDKENGAVRTSHINWLFQQIAVQSSLSGENEKGNPFKDCLFGSNVGKTG